MQGPKPCSVRKKTETCGKDSFEDCNKKQDEGNERLRQEYKERSERLALTTAVERAIPARNILRGSPAQPITIRGADSAEIDRNSWTIGR